MKVLLCEYQLCPNKTQTSLTTRNMYVSKVNETNREVESMSESLEEAKIFSLPQDSALLVSLVSEPLMASPFTELTNLDESSVISLGYKIMPLDGNNKIYTKIKVK